MFVNSLPICVTPNPFLTLAYMGEKRGRAALTPEQRADAQRLRAKWDAFKAEDPKIRTQEWLALQCAWTTQGAATQYLNGIIPLNLPTLLKLSAVIGFLPAEVSPTLAAPLAAHTVSESLIAYSAQAHAAAKFVDSQPAAKRASIVLGMHMLLGKRVPDDLVLKASEDFVSPLKRKRKKVKK